MVLDILGTGVWGYSDSQSGSRNRAQKHFLKTQVPTSKISAFCAKSIYLFGILGFLMCQNKHDQT